MGGQRANLGPQEGSSGALYTPDTFHASKADAPHLTTIGHTPPPPLSEPHASCPPDPHSRSHRVLALACGMPAAHTAAPEGCAARARAPWPETRKTEPFPNGREP